MIFRLIGNTMQFKVARFRRLLDGTLLVVDGVSVCGRYKTTARIADTHILSMA